MANRNRKLLVVLAGSALFAAACGGVGGAADAGDDRAELATDTTDVPAEVDAPVDGFHDEEPDQPQDDAGDTAADVPVDGPVDGPVDSPLDGPSDVEPDAPVDAPVDGEPDAPADGVVDVHPDGDAGPGELRLTMVSSDAWANLMPGSASSHAIFTLEAVNGGSTDVTGLAALGGDVALAADGTVVFAFDAPTLTRAGGGAFDGTIPAGATVTLDGNGTSRTSSGGYCDREVKVSVRLTWDGGPASRELTGETITLMCVY